jgi:hypothetical protein
MNIEELFQNYKDISLNIIRSLDDDKVEQLDELLSQREKILKEISKQNQSKEELKRLYGKYDLFEIDEDMRKKFEASLKEVKKEIAKISRRKDATNGYNNINARSVYLSKKI